MLEEPVAGEIHGGVGNLRGWAVATDGIDKIEIMIDGVYAFDAPYGGARGDVGGAFSGSGQCEPIGFFTGLCLQQFIAGQPYDIGCCAYPSR